MEIATEIAGESFGVGGELDRIDLCGGHHHMATGPTIDTARERLQVVLASIASVESAIA